MINLAMLSVKNRKQHVIEVGGQSNAVASLSLGFLPSELSGALTNIKVFNPYNNTLTTLQAGVNNTGIPTGDQGSFGWDVRLMTYLRDYYNKPQYLIKYCVPGTGFTPVSGAVGGTVYWDADGTDNYYTRSNAKHTTAKGLITTDSGHTQTRVFIWVQGEYETNDSATAANYINKLTAFINGKRTAYGLPNMPFIVVSLSDNQTAMNTTNRGIVKDIQKTVSRYRYNAGVWTINNAAGSIDNVYYLEQNGATVDGVHYNLAGQEYISLHVFNIIKVL